MITDIKELVELRENAEITQAEVAEVMGWHKSAVSRLESGKYDCRVSTILIYQKAIDILKERKYSKVIGAIILDKTLFKNTAYRAMISELEGLEHDGKYKGNGHHLTQRLVELLVKEFSPDKAKL